MKIGLNTDSLGHLSLAELLPVVAEAGIECLEFGCGNWSEAPHLNLAELLESAAARRELLARLADHGLEISALNCSGNPLKPGPDGKRHDQVTRQMIELARLLGPRSGGDDVGPARRAWRSESELDHQRLAAGPHRNLPLVAHSIGVRSSQSSDWTR
jgi:sugar phosphate isomerase/epimerase